jgi:hypothetical protein
MGCKGSRVRIPPPRPIVAQKRALNADERAKLATLLEEKAAGAEAGELFLVAPRIGTISPWSSKATDIAWNCDLDAIERIERGHCLPCGGQGWTRR